MIYKETLPNNQGVQVTFELPSSIWAEQVNLVGDFNRWDTTKDEMRQGRNDGKWRITYNLAGGQGVRVPLPGQRSRLVQRLARRQIPAEQVRYRQLSGLHVSIGLGGDLMASDYA